MANRRTRQGVTKQAKRVRGTLILLQCKEIFKAQRAPWSPDFTPQWKAKLRDHSVKLESQFIHNSFDING